MSIDYSLYFADPRPAEELLQAAGFGKIAGLTPFPGRPSAFRAQMILGTYGFTPESDVDLRLDGSLYNPDDGYGGNFNLVRVVMAVLKVAQGDLIVLFNHEVPVLLRRGGKVIVNQDYGWLKSPAMRALVDVPYVEESLPVL